MLRWPARKKKPSKKEQLKLQKARQERKRKLRAGKATLTTAKPLKKSVYTIIFFREKRSATTPPNEVSKTAVAPVIKLNKPLSDVDSNDCFNQTIIAIK